MAAHDAAFLLFASGVSTLSFLLGLVPRLLFFTRDGSAFTRVSRCSNTSKVRMEEAFVVCPCGVMGNVSSACHQSADTNFSFLQVDPRLQVVEQVCGVPKQLSSCSDTSKSRKDFQTAEGKRFHVVRGRPRVFTNFLNTEQNHPNC